jgi:hypothetical protein
VTRQWPRGCGLLLALLIVASDSRAQTPAAAKRHRLEVDVGGSWTGGGTYGNADANLTTPSGGTRPLFSISSTRGKGTGLEAHVPFGSGRLRAEGSGSWSRATVRSAVTDDFEGAAPATLELGLSIFTAEGSVLWFVRRGKVEPFLRGGAGWLRELTSDNALSADGFVANAGAGVKYWWRARDRGFPRRLGLRLEGRVVMRRGGIDLGPTRRMTSPALVAGAMIGF